MNNERIIDVWVIISFTSLILLAVFDMVSIYYFGGYTKPPFGFQVLAIAIICNFVTSMIIFLIMDRK